MSALPGHRCGVRQVQRRLTRWLQQAGIDGHVSAHSMRRTLVVRLLGQTGNLRPVRRALSHASISSTVRHARVADEAPREALEGV